MPGETLYRESIRIPVMTWLAAGTFAAAMVFVGLAFTNPFAESAFRNSQSGAFFIPAALFFALALFATAFGKFNIIASDERLTISAGMNANSVKWNEIDSAGEDFSRRALGNVLTAVPTIVDGESAMVYSISKLPRIDLSLKNKSLRRIIFSTRQPEELLKIIQEQARKARGTPVILEKSPPEMVHINAFGPPGNFDGVGGPPPFPIP
jgi:hypothetical protein